MKKITIKDIAKLAGVDHSTVSRSLNDSPRVAEKTKKRIKELAEELGFEYNYSARALSSQKTGTIGLIFPDNLSNFSTRIFLISLMADIHRNFEKESYNIIFDFSKNEFTEESNIKKILLRKKVDGLLIMSANQMDEEDFDFIKKSEIPSIILINKYNEIEDIPEISSVFVDNFKGGYKATKYLIETGHKKIITYTHRVNGFSGREFVLRTMGYKKAMEENNLTQHIFEGAIEFENGDKFIEDNFELIKQSDAIFAQTDMLAISMIQKLREKGINVPEDLSVVGYDDINLCELMRPNLTTMRQPEEKAADIACRKLLELIRDKKTENIHLLMEPELIVRDSVKKRNKLV